MTVICPREITTTLRRITYIFAATRSLASDGLRKQNIGEVVDEGSMSAQQTIDELVRMMRARALRYKILAEALYDRRTAAEVSAYAEELEAEAERLADSRWPSVPKRLGVLCH